MDKYEKNLKSILYRSLEPSVHFVNEGSKGKFFNICSSLTANQIFAILISLRLGLLVTDTDVNT